HGHNISAAGARLGSGHEPFLEGDLGEPRHRIDAELAHQALPVTLDGAVADAELLRDLLVGLPARHPDQDLALPAGELGQRVAAPAELAADHVAELAGD